MKAIIIGHHPILPDLLRQYSEAGFDVVTTDSGSRPDTSGADELVLLTAPGNAPLDADNGALRLLAEICRNHRGKRLKVHLLLQSDVSLRLLRANDFDESIFSTADLYPFTLDDEWSRRIDLDLKPITVDSDATARLVIFGTSGMAELTAINCALKSHFPNFTRNQKLRTRIIFVDDNIDQFAAAFIERYKPLMDNSYYRIIDASAEAPVVSFHSPARNGEEFVDIEWEFVRGNSLSPAVVEKLKYWSANPDVQLSILFALGNGDGANLDGALSLPDSVLSGADAVYAHMLDSTILSSIKRSGAAAAVRPVGMLSGGYDISAPLVEMGKTVNHIYDRCYADNIEANDPAPASKLPLFTVEIDEAARSRSWQRLGNIKRMSNIYNAMSIPAKLRSVGITDADYDKLYELSRREIELLAEVEHNRWSVEEMILGFRPCTPQEAAAIDADISLKPKFKSQMIHYDLRPYNDLRPDPTGKNVNIYDICLSGCLPLIAGYRPATDSPTPQDSETADEA